jgi:hypothetical protein
MDGSTPFDKPAFIVGCWYAMCKPKIRTDKAIEQARIKHMKENDWLEKVDKVEVTLSQLGCWYHKVREHDEDYDEICTDGMHLTSQVLYTLCWQPQVFS